MPSDDPDTAPAEFLSAAVAALLRRVPERWAEYDADALSATESQALFLLVAAGMVERRGRFCLRMQNHSVAVEGTFTATGEYGFVEAMEYLSAAMWTEWQSAFRQWRTSETAHAPAFFTERMKPDEWRLTDQGLLARSDLESGNMVSVFDFVLRTGIMAHRPPVRGAGTMQQIVKVPASVSTTGQLSIANWREGAEAFAAAFEALAKHRGNGKAMPLACGQPALADNPDGGPEPDPHDPRIAWWIGNRVYLGKDTEVSRLFWLLTKPVGRARTLAEVQRAVDGMETDADRGPDEVRKAGQRLRKAFSRLREALREAELDHHVLITRGGSQEYPEYTMVWRFPR